MGVPGPVTSAPSEGVHQLIRSGAATLVTCGADVLELVGARGEHLVDAARAPDRARDRLTRRQQQVLDAVPLVAGTAGSIARRRHRVATAGLGARCELRAPPTRAGRPTAWRHASASRLAGWRARTGGAAHSTPGLSGACQPA